MGVIDPVGLVVGVMEGDAPADRLGEEEAVALPLPVMLPLRVPERVAVRLPLLVVMGVTELLPEPLSVGAAVPVEVARAVPVPEAPLARGVPELVMLGVPDPVMVAVIVADMLPVKAELAAAVLLESGELDAEAA